ncbi:MAG: SDR family NAD(P)-dependent oxidoreductase, partial [Thermoanaerobaculia bacterium]
LSELARELSSGDRRAVAVPCDVLDAASVREAARRAEQELGGPIDLAIANAGVSIPGHATKFNLTDAEQIIRVNVLGVLYLFDAVIPSMVERRSGHFVGVASLAGLRGLPSGATYSASKAAVQAFLEASRIELAPYDVAVTTVNPGFVATPMTEKNRFRMPFLMTAEESAALIAERLGKRPRVIEFPAPMSALMRFARLLPAPLYERMVAPYGRRKLDPGRVKR